MSDKTTVEYLLVTRGGREILRTESYEEALLASMEISEPYMFRRTVTEWERLP